MKVAVVFGVLAGASCALAVNTTTISTNATAGPNSDPRSSAGINGAPLISSVATTSGASMFTPNSDPTHPYARSNPAGASAIGSASIVGSSLQIGSSATTDFSTGSVRGVLHTIDSLSVSATSQVLQVVTIGSAMTSHAHIELNSWPFDYYNNGLFTTAFVARFRVTRLDVPGLVFDPGIVLANDFFQTIHQSTFDYDIPLVAGTYQIEVTMTNAVTVPGNTNFIVFQGGADRYPTANSTAQMSLTMTVPSPAAAMALGAAALVQARRRRR